MIREMLNSSCGHRVVRDVATVGVRRPARAMRQRGLRLRLRAGNRPSAGAVEAVPVQEGTERQKSLYRLKGVSFGGAGIFFWWELGVTDHLILIGMHAVLLLARMCSVVVGTCGC